MHKDETREQYIKRITSKGGKARHAGKTPEERREFAYLLAASRNMKRQGKVWKDLTPDQKAQAITEAKAMRSQRD